MNGGISLIEFGLQTREMTGVPFAVHAGELYQRRAFKGSLVTSAPTGFRTVGVEVTRPGGMGFQLATKPPYVGSYRVPAPTGFRIVGVEVTRPKGWHFTSPRSLLTSAPTGFRLLRGSG